MLNILVFIISKFYFINFNILLYNSFNIKIFIILPLHLNIFFYVLFIYLFLCFQIIITKQNFFLQSCYSGLDIAVHCSWIAK